MYSKSIRYQDVDSIVLCLISFLLLIFGIVSTSQVNATENKVQDKFFDAVESKAIENKAPAFATEAASRLIKRSADINKALPLLNWSEMDGLQVVHLPSEELDKIKELAVNNDVAVQAVLQIQKEVNSMQVDATEISTSGFVGLFFPVCFMGIDGRQIKNDMYFTLSSGGSIPVREGCRLFAWVSAVNGIRITRSKDKPRTLILDYVGDNK